MNLNRFPALVPILLVLLSLAVAAADFSTPRARVQDAVERVVAILREPGLEQEMRWNRIAMVIREAFDFRTMSQSVLATQWQKATPREREQFTEYFTQYIEQVYREKIEAYAGQQIVYGRETTEDDRASVDIEIATETISIPIVFKLRSDNGNWLAYDVVIEGVSLVNNYRATFAAISRNEGMDAIMADIQERMARHRDRVGAGDVGDGAAAPH